MDLGGIMIAESLRVGDIIRWQNDPPERNFLITEVQNRIEDRLDDLVVVPDCYYVLDLSTNSTYHFYADQLHNKAFISKVA